MNFPSSNKHASKHLLLAYVWSVNNIGAIAIAPGLVSLVRNHQANLPIKLLASQPEQEPARRRCWTSNFEKQVQRTYDAMAAVNRLGNDVLQQIGSNWKKTS